MGAGPSFSSLLPLWEKVDRAQRETDEGFLRLSGAGILDAFDPLIRPFGAPSPTRGEGKTVREAAIS